MSGPRRWACTTCPFETDDPDVRRGHEAYLETHPRGWLGYGEEHVLIAFNLAAEEEDAAGADRVEPVLDDPTARYAVQTDPQLARWAERRARRLELGYPPEGIDRID